MVSTNTKSIIRVTRSARGHVPGDGVRLAFGYWPGRRLPVIALHGLTASHLNFIGIGERLEGRCSLFALDLRGRGDSEKPEGPYGLVQHARDVAAAMRAMGFGPSIVVGHSMGAYVATALAAEEPTLVSGLVLIDGGYGLEEPSRDSPEQGASRALLLRIMQLRQTYPSREAYREFWRSQPHFPPEEWNPWVEAFLDYEVVGDSLVRPKAAEEAVRADFGEVFHRDTINNRLNSIRVPTVWVRAEIGLTPGQPPLFPDVLLPEFRARVPHVEDYKLAGTTHYTIALGEYGAAKIADLISDLASRSSPELSKTD